jgi:hypothetical protein
MTISTWRTAACLAAVFCVATLGHAEDKDVTIKAIKLTVPEAWEQKPPSNNLRLGEFKITPVKDEGEAEIVVYSFGGGGGGIDDNVKRWVEQFSPEGRKVKVTQGKAPQGEYVVVDISGTYNQPVGPPIQRKTKAVPDSRMLALIIGIQGEGNYFLKFTGGKETVAAHEAAFRKSFGGVAEDEKPYEK